MILTTLTHPISLLTSSTAFITNTIYHNPYTSFTFKIFRTIQLIDMGISILQYNSDNINFADLSAKMLTHTTQYIAHKSHTWPPMAGNFMFDTFNHLYNTDYTNIIISALDWYASYILASRDPKWDWPLREDGNLSMIYFTCKMLYNGISYLHQSKHPINKHDTTTTTPIYDDITQCNLPDLGQCYNFFDNEIT